MEKHDKKVGLGRAAEDGVSPLFFTSLITHPERILTGTFKKQIAHFLTGVFSRLDFLQVLETWRGHMFFKHRYVLWVFETWNVGDSE